jgi:hypothetical protein
MDDSSLTKTSEDVVLKTPIVDEDYFNNTGSILQLDEPVSPPTQLPLSVPQTQPANTLSQTATKASLLPPPPPRVSLEKPPQAAPASTVPSGKGRRRRGQGGVKPIMLERERISSLDAQWPEEILKDDDIAPLKQYIVDFNLNSEQVQQLKAARRRYRGRMYTSQSRRSKQQLASKLSEMEAESVKQTNAIAELTSTLSSAQVAYREAIRLLNAHGIAHSFEESI